jgi:quercetin dioxygenase-like cupin family protein
MAKVRLITEDKLDWIVSGERQLDDEERGKLRQGELTSRYRIREAGDGQSPQLVELAYEPGAEIQTHCHDEDEIIYILSGAMVIGARTVGPGASLTIPGSTFYGFRAGPEGLTILNFRPRSDTTFHLPPARAVGEPA